MSTIEERVREVANDIVALPEDAGRDLRIAELGLDSLDITELVMEIEEEFDINIPEDDVDGLETLGDIIDYVAEKTA